MMKLVFSLFQKEVAERTNDMKTDKIDEVKNVHKSIANQNQTF